MGYRNEDGTWHDTCLEKVHPNEPIFVLRAQDLLAPDIVEQWANMAQQLGCPRDKCEGARRTANEMRSWPNRKNPD